jgi:hypothetical protein
LSEVKSSWLVSQLVTSSRVAVAEAQRQFDNPEEGGCPPLEAITRRLVKTQVCALVNCKVRELAKHL